MLEFKEDPSWRHGGRGGGVSSITLDQGMENGLNVPANKNTVVNRATRELTELVTVHRGQEASRETPLNHTRERCTIN